jgi:hypothetical protein
MQRKLQMALLLLGVAAGAAQAQSFPAGRGTVVESTTIVQPAGPGMDKLAASAQRLRDAIQLMAEKPAGPERDTAIAQAQAALRATEVAMADLPPAPVASSPAAKDTAGYDTSVRALMAAADALRASIHTIARRPAGPERNEAIREANRALLKTQVAMANAYDATTHPQGTNVLGAGQGAHSGTRTITVVSESQCTRLGTMWACKP